MIAEVVRSKVLKQIVEWNPMKTNNTDGLLDVVGYMQKCTELYGVLMETITSAINGDFETAEVLGIQETCNY